MGPRISNDRQNFPPNNIIHMLGGAGFLWMGWAGFNGGAPFKVGDMTASLAIFNTHLCTATSLLVWLSLDMVVYKKSSVIGAVQGMITGLVCITPAAGKLTSLSTEPYGVTVDRNGNPIPAPVLSWGKFVPYPCSLTSRGIPASLINFSNKEYNKIENIILIIN